MQCLLARRLGPESAHTGLKRRLGAASELAKSLCCTIWVEQGSSTMVPLCADQARIEQRSKQIAKRGGRKQRLLVGESLSLTFTTLAAPFHCSIRDRSGCLGKHLYRFSGARIVQAVAALNLVVGPLVVMIRVPVFKNERVDRPGARLGVPMRPVMSKKALEHSNHAPARPSHTEEIYGR